MIQAWYYEPEDPPTCGCGHASEDHNEDGTECGGGTPALPCDCTHYAPDDRVFDDDYL